MPSKTRCFPIFSDEDADLRLLKWYALNGRYAVRVIHDPTAKCKHRAIYAHHLVASRIFGEIEKGFWRDHINLNKLDNRRSNIRLVTRAQNSQNLKAAGRTGIRGVTFRKDTRRPWEAKVSHLKKTYHCGRFDTAQEAEQAAIKMREQLGFVCNRPNG